MINEVKKSFQPQLNGNGLMLSFHQNIYLKGKICLITPAHLVEKILMA